MQVFRMLLLWINWFFFWYTTLLLRTREQRSVVFCGKPHRINIKLLLLYLVQCLLRLTQQTSRHPKLTFIWILHPALPTKHFKGCPWIRMGSLHYIGNESAPCFQADAADWSHFSKCAVRMERNTKTWSERLNKGERDKFQRRVWGASHAETL